MLAAFLSVSTVTVLLMRSNNSDSCNTNHFTIAQDNNQIRSPVQLTNAASSPLNFMKSKLVLMVSHELSLSGALLHAKSSPSFSFFQFDDMKTYGLDSHSLAGGPLLLMELAFLLRGVGSDVVWITNQKPSEHDQVIYSLESKMLDRGVQVIYSLQSSLFVVIWVTVVYAWFLGSVSMISVF